MKFVLDSNGNQPNQPEQLTNVLCTLVSILLNRKYRKCAVVNT